MNTLKMFVRSALGAALGVVVFQLITQRLVNGSYYPEAIAYSAITFGLVYGFISAFVHYGCRPSLPSHLLCGFGSFVVVGGFLIWVLGGGHLQAVAAKDLVEVVVGPLGLIILISGGGYLATRSKR